MLRIRASLLVALILIVISIAILAHRRAAHRESPSVLTDEAVLNAPYSAERHFISVMRSTDGATHSTETHGSEARDSKGRTYSADDRLWVYLGNEKREMLYRIQDPVASTETKWDSSSKEVKVIHWHPSAQDSDVSKAIEAWTIPYPTTEKLSVQKLASPRAREVAIRSRRGKTATISRLLWSMKAGIARNSRS